MSADSSTPTPADLDALAALADVASGVHPMAVGPREATIIKRFIGEQARRITALEDARVIAEGRYRALDREHEALRDALRTAEARVAQRGTTIRLQAEERQRLVAALQLLIDARAGQNEHGWYWLTEKLRHADATAESVLGRVGESAPEPIAGVGALARSGDDSQTGLLVDLASAPAPCPQCERAVATITALLEQIQNLTARIEALTRR